MSPFLNEKRRHPRKHTFDYLIFLKRDTGKLLGVVVDITIEGVKLISELPFQIGDSMPVKMVISINEKSHAIVCDARCAWCQKGEIPEYYESGFHLLNLSEEDQKLIQETF